MGNENASMCSCYDNEAERLFNESSLFKRPLKHNKLSGQNANTIFDQSRTMNNSNFNGGAYSYTKNPDGYHTVNA